MREVVAGKLVLEHLSILESVVLVVDIGDTVGLKADSAHQARRARSAMPASSSDRPARHSGCQLVRGAEGSSKIDHFGLRTRQQVVLDLDRLTEHVREKDPKPLQNRRR